MTEAPVVQVLEKEKYFTQHLLSLPDEVPYPPLTAASTLRVRTRLMCLTINNLTYPRLGFLLNWWAVHPLPPTTPAPYNDADKYGRTACWGFSEVLESTLPSVPKGSYLWGFQPLGTLAQDLAVREAEDVPGHVHVTSPHRQRLMPIYNRYLVHPPSLGAQIAARADGPAYEAIFRIMFETAYLLNRFVFAVRPGQTLHPGPDPRQPWTPQMADLTGATVLVLAPGAKTALALAHQLKHLRDGAEIKTVIGAASQFSKKFVEETHVYDEVISTDDSPATVLSRLQVGREEKVVLIDFGGRAGVGAKWITAIKQTYNNVVMVAVGSEVLEQAPQDVLKGLAARGETGTISVNASDMRNRAMEKVGEKEYFDGLSEAWEAFKGKGIDGFKIRWGEGMEDVKKGWDSLCRNEVLPDEGRAYLL